MGTHNLHIIEMSTYHTYHYASAYLSIYTSLSLSLSLSLYIYIHIYIYTYNHIYISTHVFPYILIYVYLHGCIPLQFDPSPLPAAWGTNGHPHGLRRCFTPAWLQRAEAVWNWTKEEISWKWSYICIYMCMHMYITVYIYIYIYTR